MERVKLKVPDGTLSALHFGDPDKPVQLILCHANGFNGQSYRRILEPLDVPALALDLRGHGQTDLPTDVAGLANWQIFADDIARVFDHVVTEPVVLAGHSYGAVSGLLALPQIKDRVRGYVGFDPVLVPWLFRKIASTRAGRRYMKRRIPIALKAGQRTSDFDSVDAAFTRYQGRGAFKGIPDDILRDYLEGGTKERSDGRVELACDPRWEQAIFVSQAHNLFRNISLLPNNSRIIFAGGRGRVSTAGQRRTLQRSQPAISVEFEQGFNHLFPFQEPAFATDAIRSVLARP